MTETFVGEIDLAQVALYMFWVFFAGLILYLQYENKREGFPLKRADGQDAANQGITPVPEPKIFNLPHGKGPTAIPDLERDNMEYAMVQTSADQGSPFVPTGNPLVDGIGPAAWTKRDDVPEYDGHGHPKIVPLRTASDFSVTAGRDPRGLPVVDADHIQVGTISDVWIDKPEQLVRYLEIELDGGAGKRLVPMTLSKVKKDRVRIHSLKAGQFEDVPTTKADDQVTKLEEEKISAYYCGGKLYASADRLEPQL